MASSTLRCCHAKCDPWCFQNLLPDVRTMSATSRVGRLIASSASWNASPLRGWKPQSLPEDLVLPADDAWTSGDKRLCGPAWSVQAAPGWYVDLLRLRACEWQSYVEACEGTQASRCQHVSQLRPRQSR